MHFSSGKVEIEYSVLYPLALLCVTWLLWYGWPAISGCGFVEWQCEEVGFCVPARPSFLSWCWVHNAITWIGLTCDTFVQLIRPYLGPLQHLIPAYGYRYTPCLAIYSYSVIVMTVVMALAIVPLLWVWSFVMNRLLV